jgi:predicted nucleic acid-binding protein
MRFLDTSFVIALLRRRERHHDEAAALWSTRTGPLLTTQGVVGEVWTFMRRREHHDAAIVAVDALQRSPRVTVLDTDADVHDAAWRWLRRHDEHPYSFVDAVSFEVMRRRRLREAFAFDDDFARAGYVEVRI